MSSDESDPSASDSESNSDSEGDTNTSSSSDADDDDGDSDTGTDTDSDTGEDPDSIDAEVAACVIDGHGQPISMASAQNCGPLDAEFPDCQSLVADEQGCLTFTPRRPGAYGFVAVQGLALPERVLTPYWARVDVHDGSRVDLGRVPLVDVGEATVLEDDVVEAPIDADLRIRLDTTAIDFDGHPREIAGARVDRSVWPAWVGGPGHGDVLGIWAFAPTGPWSSEPIGVKLEDTFDLEIGTRVNLFEIDVPSEGSVLLVGEAEVTAEGSIATKPDQGFRSISWLILARASDD